VALTPSCGTPLSTISAHHAIAEIHVFGTSGYRWVLDADIEAAFDSLSHTAVLERVRARVKDKRVLWLVLTCDTFGVSARRCGC
jgi:retron-type reverse transcriptase